MAIKRLDTELFSLFPTLIYSEALGSDWQPLGCMFSFYATAVLMKYGFYGEEEK